MTGVVPTYNYKTAAKDFGEANSRGEELRHSNPPSRSPAAHSPNSSRLAGLTGGRGGGMRGNRGGRRPDSAVLDVARREVGDLAPRNFAHRFAGSEDLVLRFRISKSLQQHLGCVNTINFNSSGDTLLSGSDDRHAILWDWQAGKAKFSFHTGHLSNVFQAKFMPFTNDQTIVTSAADGQVRHAHILEGGVVQTTQLTKHLGRVHKLAIEPGSPHIFYTCGEDGLVQHIDLRSDGGRELFTCRRSEDGTREGLIVHLNTIAIDPRNPNLFAVGGSDEYARVYDMRKYWDGSSDCSQPVEHFCPPNLIGSLDVGITGLAFSSQSELLVSYYNDFIYLFERSMGLGPGPLTDHLESHASEETDSQVGMDSDEAADIPQMYMGHGNCETVKGVGFFGPKCEYVVSGSDCGRIFIWKRNGKLIRVMEADVHVVNCVEPHPHAAVLASSGIESDVKIWTPDASSRATLPPNITEGRPVEALFRRSYGVWFGLGNEDSSDEESLGDGDDEDDEEADSSDDEDEDDDDDSGSDGSFEDVDDGDASDGNGVELG